MKLEEIIEIADEGYPDGLVLASFQGMRVGDTLAEFVAREIKETYDAKASDKKQLAEAVRVIKTAREELQSVERHLREAKR